jgi:hypothetical protein
VDTADASTSSWLFAAGFGSLRSLVKLQASYNPLEALPDDMWEGLPALELFRLAVGHLNHWPAKLGESVIMIAHSWA